ncbi:MAG: G5 domain-containing protein [Wujia sp.]
MKKDVFRSIKNVVAYLLFLLMMICYLGIMFNLRSLRPQESESYVNAVPRQEKLLYREMETYTDERVLYINDNTLPVGERYVSQEAQPGVREHIILVTYSDDEVIDRREVSTKIVEKASPKIVHVGTRLEVALTE